MKIACSLFLVVGLLAHACSQLSVDNEKATGVSKKPTTPKTVTSTVKLKVSTTKPKVSTLKPKVSTLKPKVSTLKPKPTKAPVKLTTKATPIKVSTKAPPKPTKAPLKQTTNTTTLAEPSQVTAQRQGPCHCKNGACGCCSRILYDRWKQKACVNITYDPDEFSFTAKVMMNDRVLYTRSVSGKNPRPICVPVPRIPVVRACVRFYNIYFQGRNMHMCINMEGRFQETTLFKVGLDCVRFGANGVALVRPEDGGGLGQIELLPSDPGDGDDDDDDDDDDYDDDDYDDDDDDDDDDDLF